MARVAITGASGLLGGNLAALLIAEGHEVVATRRAGSKVAHLDDLGAALTWRDADLTGAGSIDALAAAFRGCAAVFHCAAAVSVKREVTAEMTAANVTGTANVISSKPERKRKIPKDRALYRTRYLVEVFFHTLKRFRGIATRFDKTRASYLAFVHIACFSLWLN